MGLVALDTPVHADKCLCAQNKHEQGGRGSIKSSCFMPSCPERATGGDQDLEGWRGKARGRRGGMGWEGESQNPMLHCHLLNGSAVRWAVTFSHCGTDHGVQNFHYKKQKSVYKPLLSCQGLVNNTHWLLGALAFVSITTRMPEWVLTARLWYLRTQYTVTK